MTSTDVAGHALAMNLRGAHAGLRRRTNLALTEFGLSADQFVLLAVLAAQGPATQQDLVRACHSDTATIGTMLCLLESTGLVERTPHPTDKRARTVTLTTAGQRLEQRMRQATASIRSEITALFNGRELKQMTELLARLIRAMAPPARTTTAARQSRAAVRKPKPNRKPTRNPL